VLDESEAGAQLDPTSDQEASLDAADAAAVREALVQLTTRAR
jgi:hypothetical protein